MVCPAVNMRAFCGKVYKFVAFRLEVSAFRLLIECLSCKMYTVNLKQLQVVHTAEGSLLLLGLPVPWEFLQQMHSIYLTDELCVKRKFSGIVNMLNSNTHVVSLKTDRRAHIQGQSAAYQDCTGWCGADLPRFPLVSSKVRSFLAMYHVVNFVRKALNTVLKHVEQFTKAAGVDPLF